ncbi:MAG: serine/threonine-protein kinase [Pseudomonadota bacterium]
MADRTLRARQRIGKYRVEKRIASGPYATVYAALDTIERQRVALKIPNSEHATGDALEDFKREVRLAARLYHPNILPLKDASFIDGRFVIVTHLGGETLAKRMGRRMSLATMVSFAEQILEALAYAHGEGVLHCDIKPENLILFEDEHLMLADFGIAKTAMRTIKASGSGTLGYLAPEQAMGRPSPRSDVFAAGLLLYRLFAGHVPEWPFDWPPAGIEKLKTRLSPDGEAWLRRALKPRPADRFRDAQHFQTAFQELKRRGGLLRGHVRQKSQKKRTDWQDIRVRQFKKLFGRELETHYQCHHCDGPISERMVACPWCSADLPKHEHDTRFPAHCPSCYRGTKLDWVYCPTCYGPGFEVETTRQFPDKRYTATCHKESCGGPLMPFMRYCPWCHTKTKQAWSLSNSNDHCERCGWGVASEFWTYCPWCRCSL